MITNEILSLLIAHGFDPYIGFLHGIEYGRPSLALDVVEEFRHPVIDRLILNLFNKNVLTKNDFRPVEGEGIYLTKEALPLFFKHYEERLKEPFQYQDESMNFRKLLKHQVQLMNRKIQYNQPYIPFKLRD